MSYSRGDAAATCPVGGTGTANRPTELAAAALPRQRGRTPDSVPVQTERASAPAGAQTSVAVPAAAGAATLGAPALSVSAAASAVGQLRKSRSFSAWLRFWGLHLEVGAAFLVGVTVAFVEDSSPHAALLALGVWLLGAYHNGRAVTTPLTRQVRSVVASASLPLSALAAGVAFFGLSPDHLSRTFITLGAAGLVSVLFRTARWRWQAPVRVVVVGDRAAIATATTRWGRSQSVQLVGGLVTEPGLEAEAVPHEILGAPTSSDLGSARSLVTEWRADLVVVAPGPAVTSEVFRRITWALEGTQVAVGVSGLLDSVSPHRITPGKLENVGVIDVRPPRPSTVVRGIKAAGDRVLGAALLLVCTPLLLVLAAAVRLDSKGPALFTQTRIGKGGKPFTIYKMRTMVAEADAVKSALAEDNEFDSILFKIREDPRITRVGKVLRKSSLDELPQLINVVRGEMSLVGPRPHLPQEVAEMDADTQRRHAVQPGITGLWQVSGRSDLDWGDTVALDTYYADNWSLAGDAKIAARTVTAVLGAKGAY